MLIDIGKVIKERFRVFEKIINAGYNTDKKIIELKVEDLILLSNFNRSDLVIAIGIKNSLANKNLVTFLCGIDSELKNEKRRVIYNDESNVVSRKNY